MDDKTLDHILTTDDELLPSSGFVESVMARVHQEAAAPAPLPFPWKRALPGMILAAGAFAWTVVRLGKELVATLRSPELLASPAQPLAIPQSVQNAAWVAVALGAALFSWLLTRRIAGNSGLL